MTENGILERKENVCEQVVIGFVPRKVYSRTIGQLKTLIESGNGTEEDRKEYEERFAYLKSEHLKTRNLQMMSWR